MIAAIKSKDFTVRRQTIIGLGHNLKLIALVAEPGYIVRKTESPRNVQWPDSVGYEVVHADPIRHAHEGAVYYVDFHPHDGDLIFSQGTAQINFHAVSKGTFHA